MNKSLGFSKELASSRLFWMILTLFILGVLSPFNVLAYNNNPTTIGPFVKSGEIRIYSATSGNIQAQVTKDGGTYSHTFSSNRIWDTGISVEEGDTVSLLMSEPGYGNFLGWLPVNGDTTCGLSPYPMWGVSSYISWAESYGESLVSQQCWSDAPQPQPDDTYDFEDVFIIVSYTPGTTPPFSCPQSDDWCTNHGGIAETVPYDVSDWYQCRNWCDTVMNNDDKPLCQYNADGPRNCWVNYVPGGDITSCTWGGSNPPYGAVWSGYGCNRTGLPTCAGSCQITVPGYTETNYTTDFSSSSGWSTSGGCGYSGKKQDLSGVSQLSGSGVLSTSRSSRV